MDQGRLRAKTRRVIRLLEKHIGIPVPRRPTPPPLDMLIATILSQNTNDKNSHRAFTSLRKKYPTWERASAAPRRSIEAAIRSGGMARLKSATIRDVLRSVKSKYGGFDLNTLKRRRSDAIIRELSSMNGVGVKTAACVLLFSLGRDVFPVDTHVHRLCVRLGLSPASRTPEKTFEIMSKVVPRGKSYSFHTNLIRFGRRICRSADPLCGLCPLFTECEYDRKNRRRKYRSPSETDHDFMLLDNVLPGNAG